MKKIFSIAFSLTAASVMLTGCMFEQDDFFDESASLRIQHTNDEIQDLLCTQSTEGNGWVLQYFVAGTDDYSFPGFNIVANFTKNGKVTMASDHAYLRNNNAGKYTEASSLYDMLSEEGPMISFNSWNDILSVFADPMDPSQAPGTLVPDGFGMGGDYNLIVMSYGKDEIKLRGERYMARSRMIPCNMDPKDYIDACNAMKSSFCNDIQNPLTLTDGKTKRYVLNLHKGDFTVNDRVDDPLQSEQMSCVFTPKGLHIEKPHTLGGNEESVYQDFVFDTEKLIFVCEQNPEVKLLPAYDNAADFFNHTLTTGLLWKVGVSESASESMAAFLAKINSGMKGVVSNSKFKNIQLRGEIEKNKDGEILNRYMYVNVAYTSGIANLESTLSFKCNFTENADGFTLSGDLTPDNTNATKYKDKALVVEILDYFKDATFTLSDTAPSITRTEVKLTKSGADDSWFVMKY
ncbi:MAG: DUF4302 domain-containing protein [Bacteroidales bacterium]|nr:DUF4302 domain-containing protein [Candidatus Liminaster caballi]